MRGIKAASAPAEPIVDADGDFTWSEVTEIKEPDERLNLGPLVLHELAPDLGPP